MLIRVDACHIKMGPGQPPRLIRLTGKGGIKGTMPFIA